MLTLLIFLAVLGVLVLTHEFGHFIVARRAGMKVEEFGFGFPPRAVGIRRITTPEGKKWHVVWGSKNIEKEVQEAEHVPGTVYSINWLPLGGFVKIKGEDSAAEGANDPDSFTTKKAWQKMLVLVAGVFMNLLTAVILLSAGYMIGMPTAGSGNEHTANTKLVITEVLPGKPAEQAGISTDDIIVQVDTVKNPSAQDFQDYINTHKDTDVVVTLEHNGQNVTKKIHPIVYPDTGKGGIGVGLAEVGLVKYPWYQAIYYGLLDTWYYIQAIFVGLFYLIKGLFSGAGAGSVSGPVGVAVMTGRVAHLGFTYLLQFMAVLSVNLAVLNVLPVPALDGGRLLFVIINKITRKPVTPRVEQLVHTIGFFVLLLLVALVTIRDVRSLI